MKTNTIKRILAMLMVFVLVFGFMPMPTAYAAAETGTGIPVSNSQPAEDAPEEGDPADVKDGESADDPVKTPDAEENSDDGDSILGDALVSADNDFEDEDDADSDSPVIGSLVGAESEEEEQIVVNGVVLDPLVPGVPVKSANSANGIMTILASGKVALEFKWQEQTYQILTGGSGSTNDSGATWYCDEQGNYTLTFTKSGKLEIVKGKAIASTADVIGGGAGGNSASTHNGGAGGGGGQEQTGDAKTYFTPGSIVYVTVGEGGIGGGGSFRRGQSVSEQKGTAGGESAFGSIRAAGGAVGAGGAGGSGTNNGTAGTGRDGGGGASSDGWGETSYGTYTNGQYSCWICGRNGGWHDVSGYSQNGLPGAATPSWRTGGAGGPQGGGAGGNPDNDGRDQSVGCTHNTQGKGTNGTANTGGGGGGGAWGTWVFGINIDPHSYTGSREYGGYAGIGGWGGSGKVSLTGQLQLGEYLKIEKKSADTSLTDGNSCYSLEGAVYGIYSDHDCKQLIETMTTDASGNATSTSLFEPGTYYVKEITPPKGYLLDPNVYTETVAEQEDGSMVLQGDRISNENPTHDPELINIVKEARAADGSTTTSKIDDPSKEAIFKVEFFANDNWSGSATRTWYYKTINGVMSLSSKMFYLENCEFGRSDALYEKDGGPTFPMGTVKVTEAKAPTGYLKSDFELLGKISQPALGEKAKFEWTSSEDTNVRYIPSDGAYFNNEPFRGGFTLTKYDDETRTAVAQGDATLEGAEFSITSENDIRVLVDGVYYNKGDVVKTIKTNASGVATTGERCLPYGTYTIRETKAPTGYNLNSEWSQSITISTDDQMETYNIPTHEENAMTDKPIRGGAQVTKKDRDFNAAKPEGDATLAGAVFEIINDSQAAVMVKGESYNKGQRVMTITTGEDGVAKTGATDLPYGTYIIKEITAPTGYLLNTEWSATVKVDAQNSYAAATVEMDDQVKRGGLDVQKYDAETHETSVLAAAAPFEGIEFTIYNHSEHDVVVAGKTYAPGAAIQPIVTNASGFAATAPDDLPYGTYLIKETKVNEGYVLNEDWEGVIEVREDNDFFHSNMDSNPIENYVIRNDINFRKLEGENMARLANVAFRVTSKTTGESHIIVTDVNGIFDSGMLDKTVKTNANDAAVDRSGTVTDALLDSEAGVWFSGSSSKTTTPNNDLGAFPYDIYTFEELRCEANKDLKLIPAFDIDLRYKSAGKDINIGTLDDNAPPQLSTTLTDVDTESHLSVPSETVYLDDVVTYSGLVAGREYTVKGTLMDKATGLALHDDSGSEIKAETTFTPKSPNGSVTVHFKFSGLTMGGKGVVAFESVESGGIEYAVHSDIDDENQTVFFPEIGTTATIDGEHDAFATENVTLIDVVEYKHLVVGQRYTVTGTLMLKSTGEPLRDKNNLPVTATTTFQAETEDGSVEVVFTFDASELAGDAVVAFEELTRASVLYAEHKDLEDEGQTVHFPEIHTTATDQGNGEHVGAAKTELHIVDRVYYKGLTPKRSYTVKGTLYDKETGEPALDGAGQQITKEVNFQPETADGYIDVEFVFDSTSFAGDSLVAFEEVGSNGKTFAVHAEIEDEDQTVHIPEIHTTATTEDGEKEALAKGELTIVDKVEYTNLIPGKEYHLKGTLMNKATQAALQNAMGEDITAEMDFTPEESDGFVEMTFTFDVSALAGTDVVVFEDLSLDGYDLYVHADINDEDQTVHIPEIHTTATDAVDGDHYALESESIKITDRVFYSKLTPGKEYVIKGVLMDKENNTELLINGEKVTAEVKFTPDKPDGFVDVTFEFNGQGLGGRALVAFEELYRDDTLYAVHADIEDDEQTVGIPKIHTTATDVDGNKLIPGEGEITINDVIEYENLKPGNTYTATGTLVDKATGEAIKDAEGNVITATAEFLATTDSGTVTVTFTFDATIHTGKTLVAFETVTSDDVTYAVHADIEDKDQTVYIPHIGTTAAGENGDKVIPVGDKVVIKDVVAYSGLEPDRKYVMGGILMNADTEEPMTDARGNVITESVTFTPETPDGEIEMVFTVDTSELRGETYVVFETLYLKGKLFQEDTPVTDHKDIEDEGQTVYIPEIHTTATIEDEHIAKPEGTVTLIDVVEYSNLIPGNEYTINGTLMVKSTGEPLLDAEGNEITASVTFTADAAEGSVSLSFEFDASLLAGESVVAFESLSFEELELVTHEDIDDEDQTDHFPEIHTMAADADGNKLFPAEEEITVVDTITYKNLIPGKTYVAKGTLMDKATGEPLTDADGNEITAETEFTPETADGTVDVTFTFDASIHSGKTLVAFESLDFNDREIAVHADIEDEDQTVYIPEIGTTANGLNGEKDIEAVKETTIVDTVEYSGLRPGQKYVVRGTLMNSETGEALTDENGDEITAETVFTPETEDGSVEVTFVFDATKLRNVSYVVFETLYLKGGLFEDDTFVTEHKDLEDEDQTVTFVQNGRIFKVDATDHTPLEGAEILIRDLTDGGEYHVFTDEDGIAWFGLIPEHKYSYKELSAPEGYDVNPEETVIWVGAEGDIFLLDENGDIVEGVGDVEVDEDGKPTNIDEDTANRMINLRTGTVELLKRDVISGEPVENAEITVYDENGKVVLVEKTDRDGKVYFWTDKPGKFTFQETMAPDGYYLTSDIYGFTVEIKDGKTTAKGTLEFTDVPWGTVSIRKVDPDGNPLKGAVISIYSADGVKLGSAKTNANGRIYFIAPAPGRYYFVEDVAPEGYARTDLKFYFEMGEDYQLTGTLSLENHKDETYHGAGPKTGDDIAMWLGILGGAVFVTAIGGYAASKALKKRKEDGTEA